MSVLERAMACAKVQGPEKAANTHEPQVLRDHGEMGSAGPHESGAMSKMCVIFLQGGRWGATEEC